MTSETLDPCHSFKPPRSSFRALILTDMLGGLLFITQPARKPLAHHPDYFLNRRLATPANPTNPVPNSSMVAGSGTAVTPAGF